MKPYRQSWNSTTWSLLSIKISIDFQKGSNSPVPLKLPPPCGMRTTVIHRICYGILPFFQIVRISLTNIHQLSPLPLKPSTPSASFSSSNTASLSHSFMCSARMPKTPSALPFCSPRTTSLISTSLGISSLNVKGSMLMGIGSPGGSTFTYNSSLSVVYFAMDW